MNWEAAGAIGEIFGALAVVATLFYLAKQIRQNSASLDRANDYAQANSVNNINSMYIQVFAPLAQDNELASTYQKALSGADLDPVESVRFGAFVNTVLAWLENNHFQHRHELGFTDEGVEAVMEVSGPYVQALMATKAGREWWTAEGKHLYSPEFVTLIDDLTH